MRPFECYLVGGAVRDALLGHPVKDRDWVVVGATPESMLERGFRQVGADFPVFLNPETREEYALARTERKSGPGYKGFTVYTAPDVTLEDDLRRRDLTINAIAQSVDGEIIDPYGGVRDLEHRMLRHVSEAFREDPLRVLRVARFAARYGHLGFQIAPETLRLMTDIVEEGEIDHLVPERVWQETVKALTERHPRRYFETLRACGALTRIFPEIDRLFGVPQPAAHHPEIDTGEHCLMALDQSCQLSEDPKVRFAVLVHDLGKGLTPLEEWPRHIDHETKGLEPLETLCDRLKVPSAFRILAKLVMRHHTRCHRLMEVRPAKVVDLIEELGGFHRENRVEPFILACEADARGRLGLEARAYPQAEWLRVAQRAAATVKAQPLLEKGYRGEEMAYQLRALRIQHVKAARHGFRISDGIEAAENDSEVTLVPHV